MGRTIELTNASISDIRSESLDNRDADSFDFTAKEEKPALGLLLPAVQAAEGPEGPEEEPDEYGLRAEEEEQEIGLLLPAVQAAADTTTPTKPVSEAGLRSDGELVQSDPDGADRFDFTAKSGAEEEIFESAILDFALTGDDDFSKLDVFTYGADDAGFPAIPLETTGASHHDNWTELS